MIFFSSFFFSLKKTKLLKCTEGGAFRCGSREEAWALGHVVIMGGGVGVEGWSFPRSLIVVAVVAVALKVFTLNVPSAVVCAGELNAVLVHTPADSSFAAA